MSTIQGKVYIPGESVSQARVKVELLDLKNSSQRLHSTSVDEVGNYLLEEISEGSYLLFSAAWGKDDRYYWEIPVKIGPDEIVDINLLAETAQVLR